MPSYCRALYDFQGSVDSDLSFKDGEVIEILEEDPSSGWWVGRSEETGEKGDFPYNYVEKISQSEAEKLLRGNDGDKISGGDAIQEVSVHGIEISKKKISFKIEAKTSKGKKRAKRALMQMKELERIVRKVIPGERRLPPSWTANAKLGKLDTELRERTVEKFLQKMADSPQSNILLQAFLFGDTSNASSELAKAVSAAKEAGANPSKATIATPSLAHAEFTWVAQDEVEVTMQEGQFIEIVSQSNSGSPGWWQGRLVDGKTGLLPYNHVELLDSRVTQAVLNGTSFSQAQNVQYAENDYGAEYADSRKSAARKSMGRISLGLFSKKSSNTNASNNKKAGGGGGAKNVKSRAKKIITPVYTSSLESFDRLIDNGFTLEGTDGSLLSMTPGRDSPKEGDFVRLSYVAYVYDCQKQSAIEFAASDNPSKVAPEAGLLEFFIGAGEAVKGLEYAVARMKKGQAARVIMTPALGYGAVGIPGEVPANSHLLYEVTLEEFGNDASVDDLPPPPSSESPVPSSPLAGSSVPPSPSFQSSFSRKESYSRKESFVSNSSNKPPKPTSSKPPSPSKPPAPSSNGGFGGPPSRSQAPTKPSYTPGQSTAPRGGGFQPPKGKPMSLQDAIALRRQKIDQPNAGMRPVQERSKAAQRRTQNFGFAGRDRVAIGEAPSHGGGGGGGSYQAPQQQRNNYFAEPGSFTLKELADGVRDKNLQKMGVNAAEIEDYLTDAEFEKAFKMSRNDFILKPRWRQQALKRGVGLF